MSSFGLQSLVCAALALTVGVPGSARADVDDGMCVVVHQAAFEVGVLSSVDPAQLETSDPAAQPARDEPDGGHLLCASADDPRCSPLSADDTPSSPELPARASATLTEPLGLPARPLREVTFGSRASIGPTAGPVLRTYRPPRG